MLKRVLAFFAIPMFMAASANASSDYDTVRNICFEIMDSVRDNLGVPEQENIESIVDELKCINVSGSTLSTVITYCKEGLNLYTPYMKKLDETLELIYKELD